MANISLDELTSVLQKSGLPFGDSSAMQLPGAVLRSQIGSTVRGQDTRQADIRKRHSDALAKIAAMDAKLGGLYGDPSSPLFIKNPLKRETLKAGATNLGYRSLDQYNQEAKQVESEQQDTTQQAIGLYEDLTKQQIKLEKEAKKAAKGGSGKGTIKLTKEQKLAGFADSDAANYWSKIKEADFKREWVQNILSGKAKVPESGYDIKDVQKRYDAWKKKNPTKQSKTAKIDAIIDQALK